MENNDDERLGKAPIGRLLFQLAVPTVLAQVVNMLYNMVDRIYVARIPGDGSMAIAGLGVCFPITMLVAAFAQLGGAGGSSKAAICLGEKDPEQAEKYLGNCTAFLVVMSIALSVFFMLTKDTILLMFGASLNTLPYANAYLGIYLFGTISVQLTMGLNTFITCQGFAKTGMATVLIGAILNIILDPICIYGLGMGVRGAALATVISQTVSAVWVVLFLCSRKSFIRIRIRCFKIDPRILSSALLLGISPFIMQATECLVQLAFNTGMQTYGNDYYVGAMTVIFSLAQILFLPVTGIAQGGMPIISYNFGAGNNDRVKETFKIVAITAVIFTFVLSGLYILFPAFFMSIFTSDPEIIEIGRFGLRIYCLGFLFFGLQTACQQTFVALGEARLSIFVAIWRKIILLVPLAIILPRCFGLGTTGIFISEPISDILSVSMAAFLFFFNINKILARGPKTA